MEMGLWVVGSRGEAGTDGVNGGEEKRIGSDGDLSRSGTQRLEIEMEGVRESGKMEKEDRRGFLFVPHGWGGGRVLC